MTEITVCMGSSCFSRGNRGNLEAIRAWLEASGRVDEVCFKGCRCEGHCSEGPNVIIGGVRYAGITPEMIPELLEKTLGRSEP